MHRYTIAIVLLTGAAFASAERLGAAATALSLADRGGLYAVRAAYSENFESLSVGPLAGQAGWTGYGPNISISTDAPLAGTHSARHTSDGSAFDGFEIKSPAFAPAYGVLAADVRISGAGVTYQFGALGDVPTGLGGTYFNTRVQFNPDGTIATLQNVGGAGVFQPTSGTWAPDVAFQIAVETAADGSLRVYQDGGLIFTGTDIGFAQKGTAGRTQQYVGWTDNAAGAAGVYMALDNFAGTLVPEPTGLVPVLLLALLRRRG